MQFFFFFLSVCTFFFGKDKKEKKEETKRGTKSYHTPNTKGEDTEKVREKERSRVTLWCRGREGRRNTGASPSGATQAEIESLGFMAQITSQFRSFFFFNYFFVFVFFSCPLITSLIKPSFDCSATLTTSAFAFKMFKKDFLPSSLHRVDAICTTPLCGAAPPQMAPAAPTLALSNDRY